MNTLQNHSTHILEVAPISFEGSQWRKIYSFIISFNLTSHCQCVLVVVGHCGCCHPIITIITLKSMLTKLNGLEVRQIWIIKYSFPHLIIIRCYCSRISHYRPHNVDITIVSILAILFQTLYVMIQHFTSPHWIKSLIQNYSSDTTDTPPFVYPSSYITMRDTTKQESIRCRRTRRVYQDEELFLLVGYPVVIHHCSC